MDIINKIRSDYIKLICLRFTSIYCLCLLVIVIYNSFYTSPAFSIPNQNDLLDMSNNSIKRYKRPKRNTVGTTNPQASKKNNRNHGNKNSLQPRCPLLAKDSEWLDGLQQALPIDSTATSDVSDEEEVLQLVECEDGPEMKPLTIMFPGLLEEDPQILENILNKTMSTTELTRRLIGQKADFSLMKKVNRLIPSDKKWLDTLSEDSISILSEIHNGSLNSNVVMQSVGWIDSAETDSSKKVSTPNITASAERASTSEL